MKYLIRVETPYFLDQVLHARFFPQPSFEIKSWQVCKEEDFIRELCRNDFKDADECIDFIIHNVLNIDIEELDGYFNACYNYNHRELPYIFETPCSDRNLLTVVLGELRRAERIHRVWTGDPIHAAAILAEEAGEVVKAVNDAVTKDGDTDDCKQEAIQCAAMCLRFLKNFSSYNWKVKV